LSKKGKGNTKLHTYGWGHDILQKKKLTCKPGGGKTPKNQWGKKKSSTGMGPKKEGTQEVASEEVIRVQRELVEHSRVGIETPPLTRKEGKKRETDGQQT